MQNRKQGTSIVWLCVICFVFGAGLIFGVQKVFIDPKQDARVAQLTADKQALTQKTKTLKQAKTSAEGSAKQAVHSSDVTTNYPQMDQQAQNLFGAMFNYDNNSYGDRHDQVAKYSSAALADTLVSTRQQIQNNEKAQRQSNMQSTLLSVNLTHNTGENQAKQLQGLALVKYSVLADGMDSNGRTATSIYAVTYNPGQQIFTQVKYLGVMAK